MRSTLRLLPAAAVLVVVAASAACSSSPSVSPAAAAAAPSVAPQTACQNQADYYENGTGTAAEKAKLAKVFAATSNPLSHDYATWTRDIENNPAEDARDANQVSSDCAQYGISIFGSDLSSEPKDTPAPASPRASPTTSPSDPYAPDTVTYEVSGSDADVTYGPAGSSLSGSVPMDITRKLGDPVYVALTAQLQGGGSVTCKIKVDGKVISTASATGGYNIAQCEISQDPVNGGWENTNGG